MVSSACPECKILLVEASNRELSNLYAAEDEAVSFEAGGKKLATEVSNSWGSAEYSEETTEDTYFNHPDIPITAAAGDSGYGVSYPAASKDAISVGGTTLKKAEKTERGWEETVWKDSGSGCSAYEPQPAWQSGLLCKGESSKRIDNDVAAVANLESPVSVYDSYEYEEDGIGTGKLGWVLLGGTSVATPLVAGVEAHASTAVKDEGAEAFYNHTLFDVTTGSNGVCHGSYLCNGEEGYDGPTGFGAPDGPLELSPKFQAITALATGINASGGTLTGYVNPDGLETTYHFEYGKTTSYGSSIPVPSAKLGSGSRWQAVSQNIEIIGPETTYHYRLVATRGSETIYGKDHEFTTTPWTIEKAPSAEGPWTGVSCASVSACIAVGSVGDAGIHAAQWNGSEWHLQTPSTPTGAELPMMSGVSCTSSTGCTAVGSYSKGESILTLAERWNGTEWSVQPTSNPAKGDATLKGISCSSSTSCTAVGQHNYEGDFTLAEHWNGTEWSMQSIPTPAETGYLDLESISCASASACTAVGWRETLSGGHLALIEHWNGSEWAIQSATEPGIGDWLFGVSCSSATACTAVGLSTNSAGKESTLAERWNGTEWSTQSTSNPGSGDDLFGVSCATATFCTAVGEFSESSGGLTLAEHWNGTTWSVQGAPGPEEAPGYESADFESVSCLSATACTAVGTHHGTPGSIYPDDYLTLIEILAPPVAETEAATSITETGATLNGAVNPESEETSYHFEYGKTTSYGTKVPMPDESVGSGTSNVKVSKPITGLEAGTTYHFRLVATNSDGVTDGADHTLTTVPAPSWTIASTPNPAGATESYLAGPYSGGKHVSCSSSTACTAVGLSGNSTGRTGLVERWNGTEWTIQTTPNHMGATVSWLQSVSCPSSTACIAVGYYKNSSGTKLTLAEHWNGTEWSIQSTPTPSEATESTLGDVSCSSTTSCTAVGLYKTPKGTGTGRVTLAEYWNGTEWKIQSTPNPEGATENLLSGVSCSSSTACIAVGYDRNGSSAKEVTLGESWNGTEWKIQSTPNPSGETESFLVSMFCSSSTACTAAGFYKNSSGTYLTLAERWNGTEWKIQSTPNPEGATESLLSGVSCSSSTACIAVGYDKDSAGTYVTLGENWNGTEWKIQSTPNPEGAKESELSGVSCSTSIACIAVGYDENSVGTNVTLAEVYARP